MAWDLIRGCKTERDWSRGDEVFYGSESGMGSWLKEKIASLTMGKIPWKPIFIIAGVAAGLFFFPKLLGGFERRRDARRTREVFSTDWPDEDTVELTRHRARESVRKLAARPIKSQEEIRALLGRKQAA
jgi:hypothetical protein